MTMHEMIELALSCRQSDCYNGQLQSWDEIRIVRGAHTAGDGWKEGETFYRIEPNSDGRTLEEALTRYIEKGKIAAKEAEAQAAKDAIYAKERHESLIKTRQWFESKLP